MSLEGKRGLIVDDEVEIRDILSAHFLERKCEVLQAINGKEAFEILLKLKIDFIISDLRMPGGDGIELLDQIKMQFEIIPVVVLISAFSDICAKQALQKGAAGLLPKPFNILEIEHLIQQTLFANRIDVK